VPAWHANNITKVFDPRQKDLSPAGFALKMNFRDLGMRSVQSQPNLGVDLFRMYRAFQLPLFT
jgi:hypothetical protein